MEALTPADLPAYLVAHGVVPDGAELAIDALGGGISNDVWRVRWAGGGDGIVVKQALPFLRVEEVWAYDVGRSAVEHRALTAIGRLLGPGHAPAVVFADDERHAFAMDCAPAGGVPWKERLLAGEIDMRDAYRAGDLLGRLCDPVGGDNPEEIRAPAAGIVLALRAWPLVYGSELLARIGLPEQP